MRLSIFALAVLLSLTFASCPTGTTPSGAAGATTNAVISLKLTNNQVMTSATSRAIIGQSDAIGLTSYQVAITRIQLITDATINGTGWSNPLQSLTLFENNSAITDANAADPTTPGFVDLLDPAALTAFTHAQALTTADAGIYQYLFVNYAPYVRFQGSVSLSDASKLYTKSGGSFVYSTTAVPLVP